MLQLFMQVPSVVTTRLAKRCEDIYNVSKRLKELSESDDPADQDAMDAEAALQQVEQLDLSRVDLGQPSGRQLQRDYKWTVMLLLKLSLPILLSIVRKTVVLGLARRV